VTGERVASLIRVGSLLSLIVSRASVAVPARAKHSSNVSVQAQATVTVEGDGVGVGAVSPPPGTSLANSVIESNKLAITSNPLEKNLTTILLLLFMAAP
jgi:hypothetical protein